MQDIPECVTPHLIHRKRESLLSSQPQEIHNDANINESQLLTVTGSNSHGISNNVSNEQTKNSQKHCSNLPCDETNSTDSSSEAECDEKPFKRENDVEQQFEEIPLHAKYLHLCRPIVDFLQNKSEEYFQSYMLPEKFYRRFWVMDIVRPDSPKCICFTKG